MSTHGYHGLAFLQNMWVNDPDRVRALIEQHGEDYRSRIIRSSLFSGCLTGRRLKNAFGETLLSTIHFEEASRVIAGDSKTICPPDHDHIFKVLQQVKPRIVLTFGKVASDAVEQHYKGRIIKITHPAARHPETVNKLRVAAREYAEFIGVDMGHG